MWYQHEYDAGHLRKCIMELYESFAREDAFVLCRLKDSHDFYVCD